MCGMLRVSVKGGAPPSWRWRGVLMLLICGLGLAGCGTTRVNEFRTYKAVDSKSCDVTFFEVSVKGRTRMSKLEYDAGWKPAGAVDQVTTGKKNEPGWIAEEDHDQMQQAQRKMANEVMAALEEHADKPKNKSDYDDLESQLARVYSLEDRVHVKRTSESPDAPAEKFVIVLSADPEAIMQQIATVVQQQANEGKLLKTFKGLMNKKQEDEKADEEASQAAWTALLEQLKTMQGSDSSPLTFEQAAQALKTYRRMLAEFVEVIK